MGDYSCKFLVVHQEHFNIRRSLDQERIQTVLQLMPGLFARSIADLGHENGTLELSPDSVVNTAGFSPRSLEKLITPNIVDL